jgi:hypothetical protein
MPSLGHKVCGCCSDMHDNPKIEIKTKYILAWLKKQLGTRLFNLKTIHYHYPHNFKTKYLKPKLNYFEKETKIGKSKAWEPEHTCLFVFCFVCVCLWVTLHI